MFWENTEKEKLVFLIPTFNKGNNTVVVLGSAWFDAFYHKMPVELCDLEGRKHGEATLLKVVECTLDEIKDKWLYYHHDKACRTKDGLRRFLKYAYGERFSETGNYTLIHFYMEGAALADSIHAL